MKKAPYLLLCYNAYKQRMKLNKTKENFKLGRNKIWNHIEYDIHSKMRQI